MSDPTPAGYRFFSWCRGGAASPIAQPDSIDGTIPATATLAVELTVSGTTKVGFSVELFGPGDARGFDARAVARCVPPDGADAFATNLFAAVEFHRPDLPWLMTPAIANAQNRLRPWIALVAVQQAHASFEPPASSPDPRTVRVLRLDQQERDALPPLGESWAWAHAQAIAGSGEPVALDDLAAQHPERVLSRLLCARTLEPNTRYFACVVPTFAVGRKAALADPNHPFTTDDVKRLGLAPAWPDPSDAGPPFRLPVYYSWEFATGAEGDFKTIATRLRGRPLQATVGVRDLDVGHGGFGLPEIPNVRMPGVLLAPSANLGQAPADAFRAALAVALNAPGKPDQPVLAPPTWGRWHAGQPVSSSTAGWLRDLNLDPRLRAFAGAGASVVEQQQEALLAGAWAQLGDARRANRLLHLAQLTRGALSTVFERRLGRMSFDDRLEVTAPLHARIKVAEYKGAEPHPRTVTVAHALSHGPFARPASAAFRRATHARGVSARFGPAELPSPRFAHAAATLADGRVLIAGGEATGGSDSGLAPIVDPGNLPLLYEPGRNRWISAGQSAIKEPVNMAAVRLSDGRVLVFGGQENVSAQIYDPAGGWRDVAKPPGCGFNAKMVLLLDGRVLVVGWGAAVYDPRTDQWQHFVPPDPPPANDPSLRLWHNAASLTLLPSGKVLLAGGGSAGHIDKATLLFDPATNSWSPGASMKTPRSSHVAARLPDGRVLVAGGYNSPPFAMLTSAEIYDPSTNSWSDASPLSTPRVNGTAVTLSDGSIMAVGGVSPSPYRPQSPTEIYSPKTGRWKAGPPTSVGSPTTHCTASLLPNGRVLVVGDGSSTFVDLLTPLRPPAMVARPVSISDFLDGGTRARLKRELGDPSASADGRLVWPHDDQLAGADPIAHALRDHLANAASATEPAPAGDVWSAGGSPVLNEALGGLADVESPVLAATNARITRPASTVANQEWPGPDPLEPIVSGPDFPQPMFSALRDQSRDFILPGVDGVPAGVAPDTLALLVVDPAPIEAYLVGLNSALGRMLAWRGYPTDQRGTAFRQFWDARGRVPPPATDGDRQALLDIDPIAAWPPASALGGHLRARPHGDLVLLLRSPLLKRYPDTLVSVVQAVWTAGGRAPAGAEKFPLYRGTLDPDLTFVAFDLAIADAIGSQNRAQQRPGWFFVLQQQPTAPEFGWDGAPPSVAKDAASQAAATLRQPVRIAVHADTLNKRG